MPSIRAGPSTEEPSQRADKLLQRSAAENLKDHPRAIKTAQDALALFQSVNNLNGIAQAYHCLGDYHLAQNALAESERNYYLAFQAWGQQSSLARQADALIGLGYVAARKGEWLNGVSYLTQAHNLINEHSEPGLMGKIASGMGYLFNESGMPETGRTQYQRAMEYFRQAQKHHSVNNMLMMIGYSDFLVKDYPAALTHLQQALTTYESWRKPEDVKLDLAECREYLGQVYITLGQYDLARQHLQPLLSHYKDSSNPKELAQVEALLGQIYQKQGDLGRARKKYLEASRIFQKVSDPVNHASVQFALGRLELNSGNYDAAESYLKESIENTETIRRELKTRVFGPAFSASVHERSEAYIECLMRKHKLQPAKALEVIAFEASELARARSLSELLRDTQTTVVAGVEPQLVRKEKDLRHSIRTTIDQTVSLLATNYKKEELDKFEGSLTELREQHKQITAKLRQLNPDYDKFKESPSYSLQHIQKLIIEDDQTVLLEYFLGQNASYVWAITHNSVKVFELKKAAEITEAVRRVYEDLSKAPGIEPDSSLSESTAKLAEMVLAPVAAQLTASRVIVVADGALNYIPFQLLPNPSRNNEPLVATHEVINAPSASILGQLRQEKQHRGHHTKVLAAFGDPVFASNYAQFKSSTAGDITALVKTSESRNVEVSTDSLDPAQLQPLNYTKFELKNLREIAGAGALVVKGFAASRETLGSLDLSQFAILHFATHGVLDPKRPEHSGFFLSTVDTAGRAQDGFISMQDVYGLNAPVDLVVLSACSTGLGKDVRGEGLISLTRGFMYAGASSVVASLWKVDDEATGELMKHFYANMLRNGMRPAEALRAAQNTLRQDPTWQAPHYWAAFTLQGEFKEPIRVPLIRITPASAWTSPVVLKKVGGGLLVALLAWIGWVYWRRRAVN